MSQHCGETHKAPLGTRRRLRRLQFSLRALLAATTVSGLLLGWAGMWVNRVLRQGRAAAAITERGGHVSTEPAGPSCLAPLFGKGQFVNVTSVRYDNVQLRDRDLAMLRGLSNLNELTLDASDRKGITDAGLQHLSGLTMVRALHLGDAAVTDRGLEHLTQWTELEWLCLSGTGVTDKGLVHLARLKKLHTLHLSRTAVTDAGLEHLKELKSLRLVYLGYTAVSDGGVAAMRKAVPKVWIVH